MTPRTLYDRQAAGTLVGTVVYRHYTPVLVGTIIQVLESDRIRRGWISVRVKWDNPKHGITDESILGLANYEALVEEHERKAVKHRAIFDRIKRAVPCEGDPIKCMCSFHHRMRS